MKFLIIGMMIYVQIAYAEKNIIYRFGSLMVAFSEVDGFLVNKSCLEKNCEALINAKKFKDSKLPSESLKGGKNPNSVKCKLLMNGTVVIGADKKGNEQSACLFSDNSYLIY